MTPSHSSSGTNPAGGETAPDSTADSTADSAPDSVSGSSTEPGLDFGSDAAPDNTKAERVAVLLPILFGGPYDYQVPAGMALAPGDFVQVPLRRSTAEGVVWMQGPRPGEAVPTSALRDVRRRLDVPPMRDAMRELIDRIARYTMSPPGAVLKMTMNMAQESAGESAQRKVLRAAADPPTFRMTAARRRVFDALATRHPLSRTALAREAGCTTAVVRGLVKLGALEETAIADDPLAPDPEHPGHVLSSDQAGAAAHLVERVAAGTFSTTLLEGVTGSGKTEVYFEAAAEALRRGKQALVLLPEIALGTQFLDRFQTRFASTAESWHSNVPTARKRRIWRAIAEGRTQIVVGARSALFLPFSDLGVIIVDEEHDTSYKQEDGVIYHARDMAVLRGRIEDTAVILSSATPALETIVNTENDRYGRIGLTARHGGAALPEITLVDLRQDKPDTQSWIAPPLKEAVSRTLAADEQVLFFLNRRGYAPLTLCGNCGYRVGCPDCSAWLVEHRSLDRLLCHHCGHEERLPEICPECTTAGHFRPCGPGVERLHEETAALWPKARCEIMTSDRISGAREAAALIHRIERQEIDILIGTQLAAKGHHFPMLTLVGVIDADLGLFGGDLRAAERTHQMLHQVSGRAGRADRPGQVMIQTSDPEHPVMQALGAGDSDAFIRAEIDARRIAGMPPFGMLAAIIVSSKSEEETVETARALGASAPREDGFEVFGPVLPPLALLRGRHRRRLLVKADRARACQPLIARWIAEIGHPASVRVQIDINPQSFM